MDNTTPTHQVKKQQQRNLMIVAVLALVGCLGFYTLISDKNPPPKPKDKIEKLDLATPLTHVDAQSVWVERAQNQLAKQEKTENALQEQLKLIEQGKQTQDKTLQQQADHITSLENKLTALQNQLQQFNRRNPNNTFPNNAANGLGEENFISEDNLQLTPRPSALERKPDKNPDSFVPAGTFVRAIALGGADASASVTSQSDPSPMLFRILDNGTLPNHQHSHLKNCVATAAAIGDISSERGQIRLERLSCTKADTQEIIELPVEATVFGPDGKNGVQGIPLWREGALLQRAFAAGALSGISNGIAQSYTSNSVSPFGNVQTVDNGKILQYGVANGIGNAADKLAEYNIKRAEQYHPVIQLSAGTVVDVVFLKGFYLDKSQAGKRDSNSSNANPTPIWPTANNTQPSPNGLPLTPQQIAALKQKNANQGYTN